MLHKELAVWLGKLLVTHLQKVDSVVGSCLCELVLHFIVQAGKTKTYGLPQLWRMSLLWQFYNIHWNQTGQK